MRNEQLISIKSADEIKLLRKAGKILSQIIKELKRSLKIGMTTLEIDQKAEGLINDFNVRSAFKGYRGFPGCVCVSLNQEVVHGIPGKKIIKDGDIVSVDVGIIADNYYSDTAFTIGMGNVRPELQRLLTVTEESLRRGIAQGKENNHLSDISHAIQTYVEANNFSVVRDFVGHGIGRALHEDPEIPNFGPPHMGPVLKEGMVLAIEPMVNVGSWETELLEDGWTVVTRDGKPSAHFEHTVLILKHGPEVLTA